MSENVSFGFRLKQAWNAFLNKDPTPEHWIPGESSYRRPDRMRFSRGNERSIVTAVLNRISMDAAAIDIKHIRLDENDRFLEVIDSGLNNCLSIESNVDQTGRAFLQDVFMSMFDDGCVAIVPTKGEKVPIEDMPKPGMFYMSKIDEMRVGKITQWYPTHVKIQIYNEYSGRKQEILMPKTMVAIVENPFYAVMNEPSSTLQRLMRKLSLLDVVDDQLGSGKLDVIIQLPYLARTKIRKDQAAERRQNLEEQLANSKLGIGYIDGTEKIIQLNRPLENNLMSQIEYLTKLLFSQLGITQEILDGTADEKVMLNYYNRTIEPLVSAVVDEMKRKFLTKAARSKRQSIKFFRDPFKLVPVADLAELADKFTRNEIMTSNEIRQIVGMKPSDDPSADELRNKNLSESSQTIEAKNKGVTPEKELSKQLNKEEIQNA